MNLFSISEFKCNRNNETLCFITDLGNTRRTDCKNKLFERCSQSMSTRYRLWFYTMVVSDPKWFARYCIINNLGFEIGHTISNVVFILNFAQCERIYGHVHEEVIQQNTDTTLKWWSDLCDNTYGRYGYCNVTMVSGMPCCMKDLAWLRGTQTNTNGLVSGDTWNRRWHVNARTKRNTYKVHYLCHIWVNHNVIWRSQVLKFSVCL